MHNHHNGKHETLISSSNSSLNFSCTVKSHAQDAILLSDTAGTTFRDSLMVDLVVPSKHASTRRVDLEATQSGICNKVAGHASRPRARSTWTKGFWRPCACQQEANGDRVLTYQTATWNRAKTNKTKTLLVQDLVALLLTNMLLYRFTHPSIHQPRLPFLRRIGATNIAAELYSMKEN